MEGLWGMDLFLFLCCFLLGQHRNIKYRKKQKRVGAVLYACPHISWKRSQFSCLCRNHDLGYDFSNRADRHEALPLYFSFVLFLTFL